jgi:TRAP-type C4-dicarboxylate transport system permease small subunit
VPSSTPNPGQTGPGNVGYEPGGLVIRALTWLARYAVWIGGAGIIASAVLVTIEVIIRKVFQASLGGADEVSGYLFAIGTVWALPFALLRRANVRIDALYALLPRWLRTVLDFVAIVVLTVFVAVVFYHAWNLFVSSLENDTRSITPMQTPQAIPQGFWVAGLALFLVTAAALTISALIALARRDIASVNHLIGARTHQEEVADEVSALHLDKDDGGAGGGGQADGGGR